MSAEYSSYFFVELPHPIADSKIHGYLSLKDGWHHGQGITPKLKTVKRALRIARYARNNLLAVDSAPGLAGEIQLALYDRETPKAKYLEVTIEPDGSFNVARFESKSGRWEITNDDDLESVERVQQVVNDFWREIAVCRASSGYSLSPITLKTSGGSVASPSRTQETQYLLSQRHAFQSPEGLFVPT
jgi:hypothetical protein